VTRRSSVQARPRALVAGVLCAAVVAGCGGVSSSPLAGTDKNAGGSGMVSPSAGQGGAGSAGVAGDMTVVSSGGANGTGAAGGSAGGSGQWGGSSGSGGASPTAGQAGETGRAGDAGSGNDGGTANAGPVSDDGLVFWFSANVGVTAKNELISEWLDQSGNAAHATQALAELRPMVGTFAGSDLPAIVFDGTNDYLDLPPLDANFEEGLTFFCVARAAHENVDMAMVELSNGWEKDDVTFLRLDKAFSYEVARTNTHTAEDTFAVGEPRLVDLVHGADGNATLYMNGVRLPTTTANPPLSMPAPVTRSQNTIGRTLYSDATTWSGEIAEILLYSRLLSPTEKQSIRAYLKEKWNCCSN
jgi:hypothetical protein